LELQDTDGFNPYRFGLIGATDSHSGTPPVEPINAAAGSSSSETRMIGPNTRMPSGLAAVWAEGNNRDSIYAALRRKETWATTGPRIRVRFFGGFDLEGVHPGETGWVEEAYTRAVSMGGELRGADADGAPRFIVWAVKDVEGANLDRIQIVKGWSEDGVSGEQVYDVAWSDDRGRDAETGKVPTVGNTVNLETREYSNSIGSVELTGVWTDPDFDRAANAFYYVRVLEIPTPIGQTSRRSRSPIIQERAYTSPIWYDHH
jgi:hypothetical protein